MSLERSTTSPTKIAKRQSLLLALSCFIAVGLTLITYASYQYLKPHNNKASIIPDQARHLALMATHMPEQVLLGHLRHLKSHNIRVVVWRKPRPENNHSKQFTDYQPEKVSKLFQRRPWHSSMSIQLKSGKWLIATSYRHHIKLWMKLVLAGVLLVIAASWLWITYHIFIQWPQLVEHMLNCLDSIRKDSQAKHLAVAGPKAIQRTAEQFNHTVSDIQQAVVDRTQMLAAISHDLRTPITRIKLRLESLPESKATNKMSQDIDHLQHMITSILAFIKHDYRQESKEKIDLDALLSTLQDEWQDAGYAVTYAPAKQKILLLGALAPLQRMFSNVIGNAIKYGHKADIQVRLLDTQHVQIKILDEGPGIPENALEKVFLPFYRAHYAEAQQPNQTLDMLRSNNGTTNHEASHETSGGSKASGPEGSGLGLAIVRDIVLFHGGDIHLLNRKDRSGLCVYINLPVTQ